MPQCPAIDVKAIDIQANGSTPEEFEHLLQ